MNKPLSIGIWGSGSIVPEFTRGARASGCYKLAAILGRPQSREKVQALAAKEGIEKVFFDSREFLSDPEIEAVYIALPNDMHSEAARQVLAAHKHAIVEKPFTAQAAQAEEMFAIAQANNVFVFEAIAPLFMPNYKKIQEHASDLGTVKLVHINYSQYSRRYDRFRAGELPPVFDPQKAGGALMDLGVYNIHLVTSLFGPPTTLQYFANKGRGIDTSGLLQLSYPGMTCALIAAKDCAAPCSIAIQGTDGCIFSDSPANMLTRIVYRNKAGVDEVYTLNTNDRMSYELTAFYRAITTHDDECFTQCAQQTLQVMRILDESRRQAHIALP